MTIEPSAGDQMSSCLTIVQMRWSTPFRLPPPTASRVTPAKHQPAASLP